MADNITAAVPDQVLPTDVRSGSLNLLRAELLKSCQPYISSPLLDQVKAQLDHLTSMSFEAGRMAERQVRRGRL